MLVTVCGYEQNPSSGVGGVAHTNFRLYVRTDVRSANLNAHPQFCRGHNKIRWLKNLTHENYTVN